MTSFVDSATVVAMLRPSSCAGRPGQQLERPLSDFARKARHRDGRLVASRCLASILLRLFAPALGPALAPSSAGVSLVALACDSVRDGVNHEAE